MLEYWSCWGLSAAVPVLLGQLAPGAAGMLLLGQGTAKNDCRTPAAECKHKKKRKKRRKKRGETKRGSCTHCLQGGAQCHMACEWLRQPELWERHRPGRREGTP